tara:strand:- start:6041 stop:6907 length:867 start_codon:yes stop_codon:yes gene_type:complete
VLSHIESENKQSTVIVKDNNNAPVERICPNNSIVLPSDVRMLGLESVSFAACDQDNVEVMAAIALSNFKEGESLYIRGKKVNVNLINDQLISLSEEGVEGSITYGVGTSKFFELLKNVAGEIVSIQGGEANTGLMQALNRDSAIAVDDDGVFYLRDASLAMKNLSNFDKRPENFPILKRQHPTQEDVIREVEEASLSSNNQRTVLFRMKEDGGSLDGSVCGLTECDKGHHRWFLITQVGTFHKLSVAQTKQLCDRVLGGAKRELVFDSSHKTHHESNETTDCVGFTCD